MWKNKILERKLGIVDMKNRVVVCLFAGKIACNEEDFHSILICQHPNESTQTYVGDVHSVQFVKTFIIKRWNVYADMPLKNSNTFRFNSLGDVFLILNHTHTYIIAMFYTLSEIKQILFSKLSRFICILLVWNHLWCVFFILLWLVLLLWLAAWKAIVTYFVSSIYQSVLELIHFHYANVTQNRHKMYRR